MTTGTSEALFVLNHVARIGELADAATPDLVEAVVAGAAAFAAGEWAPLETIGDRVGARWTPEGVTMPAGFREAYAAFVAGGWGTLAAPAAYGGQDLPLVLAATVLETLGTANLGFALAPILTLGAIEALTHHGSAAQQALYLPKLVTGEWTGTMNLTEPQAGSDVGALRTRAAPRGDGTWSITGTKIFISFGDHDLTENIVHLVLARTPDAPAGTKGISLFLVPKYRLDADGRPDPANDVRTVSIEHKLGLHASPTCVLAFGDNGDCVGELIGPVGGGMRAMFTMMNNARLNVGLQGVQVAEAATRKAVAYALQRIQSARAGAPSREPVAIAEHPDVRRMLLRMKAQTQAARALLYYALAQADRARRGSEEAHARLDLLTPLAKAHATDLGTEVSSLGVQVMGGAGYIEETGAARHYRDARILPIYEGTNGIQAADLVGRKLLPDGGAALFALIAEMRGDIAHPELSALVDDCEEVARHMLTAQTDDRLAGSYPFLTMLSVAVCGWLMERQGRAARDGEGDPAFLEMKSVVARFYVERIAPEARGLMRSATEGSALLYELPAEALL